jgi:hypothetical protein
MADSDRLTRKDLQGFESRFDVKLDVKLDAVVDRLTKVIRSFETNLLAAFHSYGKGQTLETRRPAKDDAL